MSNIFKVNNKVTSTTPVASIVIYFRLYSTVTITELKQVNAGWLWEHIVSDNKFFFSNSEKWIVLWARKFCRAIILFCFSDFLCFHPYLPKISLWNGNFLQQNLKKSRTLNKDYIDVKIPHFPNFINNFKGNALLFQKHMSQVHFQKLLLNKFTTGIS